MLSWKNTGRHELRMMETLNIIFANHFQILQFLFDQDRARLLEPPDDLIEAARCFSSGEQILIRLALDLWSGAGNVRLWEIIESLDDGNYENVLLGLRHLRRNDDGGPEMVWRQSKMAY